MHNPFEIDSDHIVSTFAGPLNPCDREPFRRAAEAALAQIPCLGPGAIYRTLVPLWRSYFTPPDTRFDAADRVRRGSKLAAGSPIELDDGRRRRRG